MKLFWALFLSAVAVSAQSDPRREGAFWVDTSAGSEALAGGAQLAIVVDGGVVVKGGGDSRITYSLTRRVQARSLEEARALLGIGEVNVAKRGRVLRLIVTGGAGAASLQVKVPRSLSDLVVETHGGNVEVNDLDGSVVARTASGESRLSRIKGNADVISAGGGIHLIGIGGWVKAHTAAGDIVADSIGGEAQVNTSGGNISIDRVGGGLRAITGGGRVKVGEVGGAVFASNGGGGAIDIGRVVGNVIASNAGGGPILIGSAAGVQCRNASGLIRAASSGDLRIATSSGNVIAELRGDRILGGSYISTGSGDITLFLSSNVKATVQAVNAGATRAQGIVSEFPDLRVAFTGGMANAAGKINGGGPLIHIQGNSGVISIKKK